MSRRYFGTDGIRGPVGEGLMSADQVVKLGWAAGRVFCREGRGKVLIGRDTRISGDMLESALEAGLVSAGVDVELLGVLPTPGIAYLTRTLGAQAGIVISASHNPFQDNGIKFFGADGRKLDDDREAAIENQMDTDFATVEPHALGKARRIEDAGGRYVEFCKNAAPSGLRLDGLRVVLDGANGAAAHVAPAVLQELGAQVVTLACDPDGFNINQDCGSTAPEAMQRAVLTHQADLGISLDGDADRVIMADQQGTLRDGDELLYIIARARQAAGMLRGPVVGTVMSNLGLEHALQALGIDFQRAKVGDRHVMECLDANDGIIGGESSGHLICLDRTTTGDGLIAALEVLAELQRREQGLAELVKPVSKYPQRLVNVRVIDRAAALSGAQLGLASEAAQQALGDRGRILVRASGTEPLVRVMVEGQDDELVSHWVDTLANAVRQDAGA
ncbi:phosphoglucosamine mutase [Natronospira proteinivora]|uniref:Phosphoglucosamine mutase n=1 Tax=Natronospira proteinivora TaxID=1807133 RepID=A0ABT1G7C5_9GAMM|nr:phosphoglucosamine mutase [Natronospira proteinivora]MCP1726987.1 phosphoglucosamine mutase [Natronospira proteinivora]